MASTYSGPSLTVSSISGLADRDREGDGCLGGGIRSEVAEAFVDEVEGEMTESDELVDALEIVRSRALI